MVLRRGGSVAREEGEMKKSLRIVIVMFVAFLVVPFLADLHVPREAAVRAAGVAGRGTVAAGTAVEAETVVGAAVVTAAAVEVIPLGTAATGRRGATA
jgi:hypothetical protein